MSTTTYMTASFTFPASGSVQFQRMDTLDVHTWAWNAGDSYPSAHALAQAWTDSIQGDPYFSGAFGIAILADTANYRMRTRPYASGQWTISWTTGSEDLRRYLGGSGSTDSSTVDAYLPRYIEASWASPYGVQRADQSYGYQRGHITTINGQSHTQHGLAPAENGIETLQLTLWCGFSGLKRWEEFLDSLTDVPGASEPFNLTYTDYGSNLTQSLQCRFLPEVISWTPTEISGAIPETMWEFQTAQIRVVD